MRAIDYALREAWASLRRRRSAGAFAVGAIALAVMVPGALLLLTWNAERVVARWSTAAEFSVYLRDDATSEQRGAIEATIDRSGASAAREYVSKDEALTRFRQEFRELAPLTRTFDDNPFPASVEVRVRPEAERDGRTVSLVREVSELPGVADIQYDRDWLDRLAAGLAGVRNAGFALAVLMGLAAAATVAAVVRLGMHARREEIEIMRLVGAPSAFIRGPFIAEGLLQGGMGALIAFGALWLGFTALSWRWGGDIAGLLDGMALAFIPARLCIWLIACGMLVGGLGGLAASRHAG
jgi:cell division transport system permease protein